MKQSKLLKFTLASIGCIALTGSIFLNVAKLTSSDSYAAGSYQTDYTSDYNSLKSKLEVLKTVMIAKQKDKTVFTQLKVAASSLLSKLPEYSSADANTRQKIGKLQLIYDFSNDYLNSLNSNTVTSTQKNCLFGMCSGTTAQTATNTTTQAPNGPAYDINPVLDQILSWARGGWKDVPEDNRFEVKYYNAGGKGDDFNDILLNYNDFKNYIGPNYELSAGKEANSLFEGTYKGEKLQCGSKLAIEYWVRRDTVRSNSATLKYILQEYGEIGGLKAWLNANYNLKHNTAEYKKYEADYINNLSFFKKATDLWNNDNYGGGGEYEKAVCDSKYMGNYYNDNYLIKNNSKIQEIIRVSKLFDGDARKSTKKMIYLLNFINKAEDQAVSQKASNIADIKTILAALRIQLSGGSSGVVVYIPDYAKRGGNNAIFSKTMQNITY